MSVCEAYRDCRRAHSERGWSPWDDPASTPQNCVSVRSGWCSTMPADYPSQWAAIRSVAEKIGCHDRGAAAVGAASRARRRPAWRPDDRRAPASEAARTRKRRTAPRERDPEESVRVFRTGGARPPSEVMVAFIDDHREQLGVEPICRVLPIAPSTYFRHKAEQRDPTRRSTRAQRDQVLRAIIRRIWAEHRQVYGPRKVWRQMGREDLYAARCRVRRLMREMGLSGAVRGRAWTTTTHSAGDVDRPATSSIATSRRRGRISSGCRISPTWRPGVASSTSRLSLTCLRVGSSVGGSPRPWSLTSSWTRSSKPFTTDAATPSMV